MIRVLETLAGKVKEKTPEIDILISVIFSIEDG